MTEIQFLVQLVLNETMTDELKNKLIARIGEIETDRSAPKTSPPNVINTPFIQTPYLPAYCQHEYPNPWMGIVPPTCKKCGQQALIWSGTSSGTSSGTITITNCSESGGGSGDTTNITHPNNKNITLTK